MRTLTEITDAARRDEAVSHGELQYAVCAYDVLLAQFKLEAHPTQLALYFVAAEQCPREFIGPANDPAEHTARAWHTAFINVGKPDNEA